MIIFPAAEYIATDLRRLSADKAGSVQRLHINEPNAYKLICLLYLQQC